MSFFRRLGQLLGLADSEAGAAARAAFRRDHPDLISRWTSLRVTEPERYIVAIFYSSSVQSRPLPYMLYSVARDLSTARELPREQSDPYWIRGYK